MYLAAQVDTHPHTYIYMYKGINYALGCRLCQGMCLEVCGNGLGYIVPISNHGPIYDVTHSHIFQPVAGVGLVKGVHELENE